MRPRPKARSASSALGLRTLSGSWTPRDRRSYETVVPVHLGGAGRSWVVAIGDRSGILAASRCG